MSSDSAWQQLQQSHPLGIENAI